jgi:hypothetical protein
VQKKILPVGISGVIMLILALHFSFGTSTTITAPQVDRPGLRVGATFTAVFTLTNAQNAFGWQVNVTFDKTHVNVQNITLLSPWTGTNSFFRSSYNNTSGNLIAAMTFTSGSGYTNSGTANMFQTTFVVKKASYQSAFHLVSTTENIGFGAMALDPSTNQASLTLIDGGFCNLSHCPLS